MKYKLYKLSFHGAVHFGKNSLDNGEYTFCADTLFSALCHEAVKIGEATLESFYQQTKDGRILLSDAFPYMGDTYYLPKPMNHIESEDRHGDSVVKKAYKKLKYIPVNEIDNYLQGKYDVMYARDFSELGFFQMNVVACIRGEDETKPYRIESYRFYEKNGLYILVGYQSEDALELVEQLLENLSYAGIGGKRTSGMGRFTLFQGKIPNELEKRLEEKGKKYMTLSVSLPKDDELEEALKGAEYALIRRSGFVTSSNYAKEQMRKRDLYVLKAGACVNDKYDGDIYDVSDKIGKHAVYRYAKPIFMEVDA